MSHVGLTQHPTPQIFTFVGFSDEMNLRQVKVRILTHFKSMLIIYKQPILLCTCFYYYENNLAKPLGTA